ncbi:unnamed protein product [Closterium sp. Naga37s-1]|nr:unnamed protein product [Closterium sp. Naga37s-1]
MARQRCSLTALTVLVFALSFHSVTRSSATENYDVLFYSAGPYTPCGTSGNFSAVGVQGALEPYKGEAASPKGQAVSGRVTVYDDCYFALSDLSISASVDAPLSIWAGPKDVDPYSHAAPVDPYAASSFPASPAAAFAPASTAFNLTATSLMAVFLQAGGLTWDEAQVLYLCAGSASAGITRIYAQFAVGGREHAGPHGKTVRWVRKAVGAAAKEQRLLLPSPPARPPPPPPKPPAPGSSGPSVGLTNCVEAVPGRLNIYWTVHHGDADAGAAGPPRDVSAVTGSATAPASTSAGSGAGAGGAGKGPVVEMGMEARVGEGSWVAVGVSRNQTRFAMLQSDVTVGGVLAGSGGVFARDYHVTAKQTCQQVAGGFVGVCEDALLGSSPTSLNDVTLVSASRRADVTFIRFTKPAATADDRFDANLLRAPGLSALWWVVFAAGPLAPASTAAAPTLLFHDPALGYFSGGTRIPFAPPAPIRTCSPLWGTKPEYHPPLPPYAPPPPPGAAAPPPPGADAAGGVAGMPGLRECSTAVGGQVYAFDACDALPGGFLLMWSLAGITLRAAFVAQAVPDGGYAAVGLSPSGAVANSSLLVVSYAQAARGGSGGKAAGAGEAAGGAEVEVGQVVVRAGARGVGVEAVAGGDLTVVSSVGQARNGALTLLFSLLLLPNQTAAAYLVWTKGQRAHLSLPAAAAANETGGVLSLDGLDALMTSAISFERGEPKDDSNDTIRLWKVLPLIPHFGSLPPRAIITVAWAFLMPLGVMAARYLRQVYARWFPVHQALHLAAASLATVAFTMALTMPHGAIQGRADKASRGACVVAHTAMGISLMVIAALQVGWGACVVAHTAMGITLMVITALQVSWRSLALCCCAAGGHVAVTPLSPGCLHLLPPLSFSPPPHRPPSLPFSFPSIPSPSSLTCTRPPPPLCAQLSALVWRPHEDSKWRPYWRRVHAVGGAVALLLGQAQLLVGLFISAAPLFYTVLLAAWLIFALLLTTALELHFFPTFYRLAHFWDRLLGRDADVASDVDSLCASSERLAGGAGRKGAAAEGTGGDGGKGAAGGWVAGVVAVLRRSRGAGMLPERPRGRGRTAKGGKGEGRQRGRGGGAGGGAGGGGGASERAGRGGSVGAGHSGYMSMAGANAATDRRSKELLPPPPPAPPPALPALPHSHAPAPTPAGGAAGGAGGVGTEGAGEVGGRAKGVEARGKAFGQSQTVAEGGCREGAGAQDHGAAAAAAASTGAGAAAAAGTGGGGGSSSAASTQSRGVWAGGMAAWKAEEAARERRGEGVREGVREGVSEYIRTDKYNVRATVVRAPDLALRGRAGRQGEAGAAAGVGPGSTVGNVGGPTQ